MDIHGTGKIHHQVNVGSNSIVCSIFLNAYFCCCFISQALESLTSRESVSAGDKMARINQMRLSNQSAISGMLRPSFLTGGPEVRSPMTRETFSHMASVDLPSRDRLTFAQANLLSHYS